MTGEGCSACDFATAVTGVDDAAAVGRACDGAGGRDDLSITNAVGKTACFTIKLVGTSGKDNP